MGWQAPAPLDKDGMRGRSYNLTPQAWLGSERLTVKAERGDWQAVNSKLLTNFDAFTSAPSHVSKLLVAAASAQSVNQHEAVAVVVLVLPSSCIVVVVVVVVVLVEVGGCCVCQC